MRLQRELIRSESGFTIVEVMIAMSILIVVALAFSQLIVDSGHKQMRFMTKTQMNSIQTTVQEQVNSPEGITEIQQSFND